MSPLKNDLIILVLTIKTLFIEDLCRSSNRVDKNRRSTLSVCPCYAKEWLPPTQLNVWRTMKEPFASIKDRHETSRNGHGDHLVNEFKLLMSRRFSIQYLTYTSALTFSSDAWIFSMCSVRLPHPSSYPLILEGQL